MKVVIDTNVLVSAALKDRDPEAILRWIAAHPDWRWVASRQILEEYRNVLALPRLRLDPEVCTEWFEFLDAVVTQVEVENSPEFPRDQADAMFIGCALATQADYLVTGDKDFTEARKLLRTTVISVAQFKRLVVDAGA